MMGPRVEAMSRARAGEWAKIFLGIWKSRNRKGFYDRLPIVYSLWLRQRFVADFGQFLLEHKLEPTDLGLTANLITGKEWSDFLVRTSSLASFSLLK